MLKQALEDDKIEFWAMPMMYSIALNRSTLVAVVLKVVYVP